MYVMMHTHSEYYTKRLSKCTYILCTTLLVHKLCCLGSAPYGRVSSIEVNPEVDIQYLKLYVCMYVCMITMYVLRKY